MPKLLDKDKKMMEYRTNNLGIILTKGKRNVYLLFKSVNAGKKARQLIADKSFNQIFSKGKKIALIGNNTSHIKFD